MSPDAFGSADQRERFRAEAELLARIQQPNIMPIFDFGETEGRRYFVMEYVPGGNLGQRLMGRPQDPISSARLIATLARAMQEVHAAGIVHRDLKPANILLRRIPGSESGGELAATAPKITDFGVAKDRAGERQLTRTGTAIGTPSYMAPEQAGSKANDVGPAADIYSLGAILYELLTGRPPYDAISPAETLAQVLRDDPLPPHRLRAGISRDLSAVCLKCLEKAPRRRYGTAADLADDLERFIAGKPTRARPTGLFGRALRWGRRHPLAAGLAGLSAALAVALAVTAASFTLRLRSARDQLQALTEQQKRQIVRLHVTMGEADAASGDVCAAMLGFAEALRLETTTENRGRIVRRFPEFPRLVEEILPGGVIRAARFDGRRAFLAVETSDGVIHVQDSESGEVSGPIRFPGGQPRLLAVSGDGRTLVAVSVAGELCIARLPDGVMVVHDLASSAPVGSIAVDRTGASICIRHVDSACRYWTLSGHRLEPAMPTRDEAAEWSGSDRWSVQPHEDGGIRVIDSINGEVLWTITPAGRFARFAVSPAADHVVAADEEGRLQFWTGQFQVADARLPRRFGAATAIRFDATGRNPVVANVRGPVSTV